MRSCWIAARSAVTVEGDWADRDLGSLLFFITVHCKNDGFPRLDVFEIFSMCHALIVQSSRDISWESVCLKFRRFAPALLRGAERLWSSSQFYKEHIVKTLLDFFLQGTDSREVHTGACIVIVAMLQNVGFGMCPPGPTRKEEHEILVFCGNVPIAWIG